MEQKKDQFSLNNYVQAIVAYKGFVSEVKDVYYCEKLGEDGIFCEISTSFHEISRLLLHRQ